jgi:hypothetical protein
VTSPEDRLMTLEEAARLLSTAMTAARLRKEGERGRLDIMRIGGRLFTTAPAREEMKRRCLLTPKHPISSSSEPTPAAAATGSSRTADGESARASALHVAASLRRKLKEPSLTTSSASGRSRESATVLPMPYNSRT